MWDNPAGSGFVGYGTIHSQKIRALREMAQDGLPIVPTLHLDPQKYRRLNGLSYVPPWVGEMPLYVRICFDDIRYPHSFFEVCEHVQLEETICYLRSCASRVTNGMCDITIQPHLREQLGGAIALLDHILVIEVVDGNARGLLRDGQFNRRFLLPASGMRKDTDGMQKSAVFWNGESYVHRPARRVAWEDVKVLSGFQLSERVLYEYCILNSGKPLFLDKKMLPTASFAFDRVHNLFVIWPPDSTDKRQRRRYDVPALELIPEIAPGRINEFSGGAYLSHLSFYAAAQKIPMYFSEAK